MRILWGLFDILILVVSVGLLLCGCPRPTPTTPPPLDADAEVQAVCTQACISLQRAGCIEGTFPDCAGVLCRINADPHFQHYDLACIGDADGGAAIQKCGGDCTTVGLDGGYGIR